jgi:hypothetical protein
MNSPGYISISTIAVLASPRPVDPQKGTRNIVFDANLYIAEDMQQSSLCLLRFFVPEDMIATIQDITTTNFQKAYIVANVCISQQFFIVSNTRLQISSIAKNSIPFQLVTEDIEISDYAFVGDIVQVH